jgi:uncharacterized cupredoxin-like copper-binding protein
VTARTLLLLATLLFLAARAPVSPGAPAPSLELRALEFRFVPREATVRPGELVIVVHNQGEIEHNFLLDDAAGRHLVEIASILPGKSEQARVTLRAGRYPYYCNLPGHREAGMQGLLTVAD